jgi:hypothetical protein
VALQAAESIAGTVVHADGSAAAGILVALGGTKSGSATTDAAGHFAFTNVPLGTFTLSASDPTNGDQAQGSGLLSKAGSTQSVVLTLNGVGTVTVSVSDSFGTAVVGATVQATSASPFGGSYNGTTGAGGTVSFQNVLAGPITVNASQGQTTGQGKGTLAPGSTLTVAIALQSVATLQGHVFGADGVTPQAGIAVSANGQSRTTAADGSYQYVNLPLGTYQVYAAVNGARRSPVATASLATNGQVATQDLVLVGTGTVAGTITNPSNSPAAGAQVTLQSQAGEYGGGFSTTTAADGTYSLPNVALGPFTVSARLAGNAADGSGSVTLNGQTVTVNLKLLASAVNLPATYLDGNDISFQVQPDGTLGQYSYPYTFGTSGAPQLTLVQGGNAVPFVGSGNVASSDLSSREIVVQQSGLAGLTVTRKVFIPIDGYFVRYLDVLQNPGTGPVTVNVIEQESVRPYTTPGVVQTATGQPLSPADSWAMIDDADTTDLYTGGATSPVNGIFPPVSTVVAGNGGTPPSIFSFSSDVLEYGWNSVVVPPGGTVAFLHAVSIQADRNRAQASATRLASAPPELLAGMTASDAAAVTNFRVPANLVSAVAPLPGNDGIATGRLLSGDGVTQAVGNVSGTFRSESPYYGRPIAVQAPGNGTYRVQGSVTPGSVNLVPRAPFDLSFVFYGIGQTTTTAHGDFPSTGTIDLTTLQGRSLSASSFYPYGGCCDPALAVDGNLQTFWQANTGDAASNGKTPFLEVTFPGDTTVHEIRLSGRRDYDAYTIQKGRLDVMDAAGNVLWTLTQAFPLQGGYRDADISVPDVAGARSVRLTDLLDASAYPSLAEFHVLGEASAGPTGLVTLDVPFTGTGAFNGRLLYSDGTTTIPSAQIQLSEAGTYITTYTASDGSYLFPVVPVGAVTLTGTHPLGGLTVSANTNAVANQNLKQDLVFEALGSLQGTFHTSTGAPLINAPSYSTAYLTGLNFSRSTYVSNTDGTYQFPFVGPGTYTLLAVDGRSSAQVSQTVVIAAGPPTKLDVTFPPVGTVQFTVTIGGAPFASAPVQLTAGPVQRNTYTSTLGTGTFQYVPGAFSVSAYYPTNFNSVGQASGTIATEGQTVSVAIAVPGVGSISGILRSRTGTPYPNESVAAYKTTDYTYPLATAATDGQGAFSFTNLAVGSPVRLRGAAFPPGGYLLGRADTTATLTSNGQTLSRDALVPFGAIATPNQRDLWEFTTSQGSPVDIYLTGTPDGATAALPDPYLEIYNPDGTLAGSNDNISSTNLNSHVAFTAAQTGSYLLVARASGAQVGGYSLGSGYQDETHVFRLYSASTVSGLVTRDTDGQPFPSVAVQLQRPGLPALAAVTGSDGRYMLPVFPDGAFTVAAVDGAGVVLAQGQGQTQKPGDQATVNLVVPVHSPVVVTVTRGSAPVPGASVAALSSSTTALPGDVSRTAVTDATGTATFSMPLGTITVDVIDPASGQTYTASGSLVAGTPLSLAVTLPNIFAVSGTVTFSDGTPAPGVSLQLAGSSLAATSDPTGAYTLSNVPAGSYSLSATLGVGALNQPVAISSSNQVVNFTFSMLKGTVTDSLGNPASGAAISACAWNGTAYQCASASTGTGGAYTLAPVPAWAVRAGGQVTASYADGFGVQGFGNFTVSSAPTTYQVNIALPGFGRVVGTVRSSQNQGVPGATVTLFDPSNQSQTTTADSQGHYVFGHITPQTVTAYAQDPGTKIPGVSSGTVSANQDLVLDVTLSPSATVSGLLRDESHQPVAGASVAITALEAPQVPNSGQGPWASNVTTNPDGTFSLSVPVGAFRAVYSGTTDPNICGQIRPAAWDGILSARQTVNVILTRGNATYLPAAVTGALGAYNDPFPICQTGTGEFITVDGLGNTYSPVPYDVARFVLGGRALQSLVTIQSGVRVVQKQYVPPSGAFGRTLALFTNASSSDVTVPVDAGIHQTLTSFIASSSGGTAWGPADAWVLFNNPNGGRDVGLVLGGAIQPTFVGVSGGRELPPDTYATYSVSVPAGKTVGLLFFTVTRPQGASSEVADVQALANLTDPDALVGLSDADRSEIVNFVVPAGAATATGQVTDEQGLPLAGAAVGAVNPMGEVSAETAADPNGQFTLTGLDATAQNFVAFDPSSNRPGQLALTLAAGSNILGTISLSKDAQLGSVSVTGLMDNGSNTLAAGAVVSVGADGLSPFWTGSAVLDGNGFASILHVPAGHSAVSTVAPTAPGWTDGTVTAGTATPMTVLIGNGRVFLPTNISGSDGFAYALYGDGSVRPGGALGPCNVFCGSYAAVGGTYFPAMGAGQVFSAPEVTIGTRTIAGLTVTRRAFVPTTGGFVRYLDVVTNPTSAPISADYGLFTFLGGSWTLQQTASGGATLSAADDYALFGSATASSPELALVFSGPASSHRVDRQSLVTSPSLATAGHWNLTVGPGQTVILMQFLVQATNGNTSSALTEAQALENLSDANALSGLSTTELSEILNFKATP